MEVSDIWEKVYKFVDVKNQLKNPEIMSLLSRLLEDRNRLPDRGNGLYAQYSLILGYLLYHFNLDLDGANCETMLLDALRADDSLQLAHLYLGYYYFDHERFSE